MSAIRNGATLLVLFALILYGNTACNKEEGAHYSNSVINNINDQLLFEAVEKAEQDQGILSLIVYRNDEIIVEAYFGNGGADSLHRTKSVTKSVTSILLGMAIDQGYISSVDETVSDYLSEYLTPEDSILARVSIRELLTMTGGFDWNELTDPDWIYWNNWVRSDDHFLYALQVPIIHEPGTHFTYCTTGCQILSGIFTKATGQTLKAFAEEKLFTPLGIEGDRPWGADQQGFNYGGVTLELKAMDMLKIGQLCLDNGKYNNQQIVPEAWVSISTSPQFENHNSMSFSNHYGFYWWIGEQNGRDYYFANGYGGQFICIFPELDLLVIAQSELNNDYHEPGEQWMNTLSLILNDILDAVH
jgi:CubicO group peptidase (beta-lactamase class C family)